METNILTKYRPETLDEVYGNKGVIDSLKELKNTHALLFYGASGCGKTTLARIMAKELGCSIYDINCADESGRDGIRNLIQRVIPFKPLNGLNIGLVFDECHSLSTPAQQTLLKVVEDCPSHVYFFFCSTEPSKIIPTLKNRLVKYEITRLTTKEISSFVNAIWEKENLPDDWEKVKKLIVRRSLGVPREVLSLIAKVTGEDIEKALILLEDEETTEANIKDFAQLIVKKRADWDDIMSDYKSLKEKYDDEAIRSMLVGYYKGWMTKNPEEKVVFALKKLLSFPEGRMVSANLVLALYLIMESE
jgi:DNA polymerase-3 subunit gamma/tau